MVPDHPFEGLESAVLRTVADQPSLWESILPEELRRLPVEWARVDALLDDPRFFTPFVSFFDPRIGRPWTPMETYLRLMFLKFRYQLGFESLCREVSDSITWRQFCRIGLDQPVPHPTTLMKLTTRCGWAAVDGLNDALLAKAAEAKVLRCARVRVDTTVVPSNVAYPTDSGLLARAVRRIAATGRRVPPLAARSAPRCVTGPGPPGGQGADLRRPGHPLPATPGQRRPDRPESRPPRRRPPRPQPRRHHPQDQRHPDRLLNSARDRTTLRCEA